MAFDDKFGKGKVPDAFPPEGFGKGRSGGGRGGPQIKIPMSAIAGLIAAVLLLAGVGMALTGKLGVVIIEPNQAAVKVNYFSGTKTAITQPGYQIFLPFIHDVFVLDKSPQNFVMSGDHTIDENHVPYLTVRANDGSNFRFEVLEIQYQLIPGSASDVLDTAGPGDGFKLEWVKTYARSILRDEFGRYTAEEIANPSQLQVAFQAAEDRLSEALRPYGIQILTIPQQRPNFDVDYERAIEDRKVTDQDVERLIAMQDQLEREREQRLASVEREKSIALEELRGELDRERLEAERKATQVTKASDAFRIQREAEGEAQKAELIARAKGLTEKYTKEAEGVTAKAEALAAQGEVIVREAFIQQLRGIRFNLVPYSRDPAPTRIEYEEQNASNVPVIDPRSTSGS